MTPRLHRRYAKEILESRQIDLRDATTQRLIENHNPELRLERERLAYIQRLGRRYNTLRGETFRLRY